MKKIFFIFSMVALALSAGAQTNFRSVSYEEALAAARQENKLVFLDFYTVWCGPCKIMTNTVFPQKEVGDYLNARFVCLKLDAEEEGQELAKRLGVKAYPTFIGITPDEKVVFTKEGMSEGSEFIASIDRQIDTEKSPERLRERYAAGERNAEIIQAYAGLLREEAQAGRRLDESKQKQAFDIVRDYFNGLSNAQKLATDNLFVYTTYTTSPTEEIAQYMVARRNEFDSTIREEITQRIEQLFQYQINSYLMGMTPYVSKEFELVKTQINELELNAKGEYNAAFQLIEDHANGNPNYFLASCEKNFSRLTLDQQSSLISQFASRINTGDKTIRQRASRFIRKQLPDMEANLIMFAAIELSKIEENDH